MAKSTWMRVSLHSEVAKQKVMSWFGIMGERAVPYEAAILCDNQTDREKKIRVRAVDGEQRVELVRTLGGKTFSIKRTVLRSASNEGKP